MSSWSYFLNAQWQGFGGHNLSWFGARKIAQELFADVEVVEIAVPEREDLSIENDILGYRPILQQLTQARDGITAAGPEKIFTIGATCGVEILPISYLNDIYPGEMAVLWFDAHGDLNSPASSVSKHFHGMSVRTLLGEGDPGICELSFSALKASQIFLAGVRDLDRPELEYIERENISLFPPAALTSMATLVRAVKARGFVKVYLHIDVDVLDPKVFPEVSVPAAGGLSERKLLGLIKAALVNFDLVGCSLLEYAPRDGSGLGTIKKITDLVRSHINVERAAAVNADVATE